jgi:hypothetical protein
MSVVSVHISKGALGVEFVPLLAAIKRGQTRWIEALLSIDAIERKNVALRDFSFALRSVCS